MAIISEVYLARDPHSVKFPTQERQERVAACRAALEQPVSGLEDLKAVLGAASAVEGGALQWELECADLEERFR